jgi:hypothetical protein
MDQGQRERREMKPNPVEEDQVFIDEVDDELRELQERVKKWLQESSPPASTSTLTDEEFQNRKKERYQKISEKRRKSMPEIDTPKCCSLEERAGPITLYHPDFADWTSCEMRPDAADTLQRNNSPIILNVLGEAHSSLSRLFRFDS